MLFNESYRYLCLGLPVFIYCAIQIAHYSDITATMPSLKSSSKPLPLTSSLFSNSCQCRSMFTIGYCDEANKGVIIRKWKEILRKLNRLHLGDYLTAHKLYSTLHRYLPQSYKLDIERASSETINNSAKIEGNSKSPFRGQFYLDIEAPLPYVPCKQHIYEPAEAAKCVRAFNQRMGRPLKIAYVGDSTIRVFMESFVKDFHPEFNFQFMNSKFKLDVNENFLDNKAKYNIPLEGHGLQLRLYWAPYLHRKTNREVPFHQGAKDVLQRWVQNSAAADFPDIIYLSYGMWNAFYMPHFDSLSNHFDSLSSVTQLLDELSKKTKVLFQITPPVKPWLVHQNRTNPMAVLDFLNQLKFLKFSNSSIWMWDTLYPVALKDNAECRNYDYFKRIFNISTPNEWACSDVMHVGARTRKTGNNQVWNLICNRLMNREKDLCCS